MPAEPTFTQIVFIRHGESVANVGRIVSGPRTPGGLTPLGVRQSEALRDRLASTCELAGSMLVSSGYERAIETASIIAPAFGVERPIIDERFGEHDPGPVIDGMTFQDYSVLYGTPEFDRDPDVDVFPGGETARVFARRVIDATAAIIEAHRGGLVVVVAHGGVVGAIVRHVVGGPLVGGFDLFVTNTSITQIAEATFADRPPRRRLVRYNDSAHLAGIALP